MKSRSVLRPQRGRTRAGEKGRNIHCLISSKVPIIAKLLELPEIWAGGSEFEKGNFTGPSLQSRSANATVARPDHTVRVVMTA